MSLQSLLALYGNPGNEYAQAVSDGDDVAQTRMRLELAQAVRDETAVSMKDGFLTAAELNRAIEAFTMVLPGQPAFAATVSPPATISVTAKIKMGVVRMVNHVQVLQLSYDQLRGTFPTAPGVTNPADAIYPGTRVWVVFEFEGEWITQRAQVVEDNGDDPITIATIGLVGADPTYDIDREHVHFEYVPALQDEMESQLALYKWYTNQVNTYPIVAIDPGVSFTLDNGPGTTVVLLADLFNGTWAPDTVADAKIEALALYDYYTDVTSFTWPIITINAFPTATIVLDNGGAGTTVTFQGIVDGDWVPDAVAQALVDNLAVGQDYTDGVDTWPVTSIQPFPTATFVLDDGLTGLLVTFQALVDGDWTLVP